jgi:hypothetical protein
MTALIVTVMLTTVSARAQTQSTPQQDLDAAAAMLRGASASSSTEAGRQIETLQHDFADFMSSYAQRDARTTTGGGLDASAEADWRTKYLIVEADLMTLLGPPNAAAGTGAPGLDAGTRASLQQARTRLGTFYASTLDARAGNPVAHTGAQAGRADVPVPPTGAAPQTPGVAQPSAAQRPAEQVPAPTPATPSAASTPTSDAAATTPQAAPASSTAVISDGDLGTASMLLDRMRGLLNEALNPDSKSKSKTEAVGTSGKVGSSGHVTVERATLDEILAEVSQLQAMLRTSSRQ